MNEHRLRGLGYEVRPHEKLGFVLDTPTEPARYASRTEASLWAVARKLEREKLIA